MSTTTAQFVDVRLALGELVMAGHEVEFETADMPSGKRAWIVDHTMDDRVFCYRDGTAWKVKQEYIDNLLDR